MRRVRRAFAISIALAGGMFGCELIVSNTVPAFTCTPGDPLACPSDTTCDPAAHVCVTGIGDGGGTDTSTSPDGNIRDGGGESGANLAPIGATCSGDTSCQAGLMCGTTNILTTAIVDSTESSICTKTCCTSADCPSNFVCYGPGTGGNYCISVAKAGRDTVGTGNPGDNCGGNGDCRSGLCDDTHCQDTCCAATDCSPGTTCRVKSINAQPTENWVCAVPETGSDLEIGQSCSGTTKTCKNDNCTGFPLKCRPPCCSSKECQDIGSSTGTNLGVCAYGVFTTTGAQTKWCFDNDDGGTAGKLGDKCQGIIDCESRFCDPDNHVCAAVCCEDADCDQGQVCRPSQSGAPYLRCVATTAVE